MVKILRRSCGLGRRGERREERGETIGREGDNWVRRGERREERA